jgi:hypothetical protein
MELYELPKDRPIATRWAGSGCALIVGGAVAKARVRGAEGGFEQEGAAVRVVCSYVGRPRSTSRNFKKSWGQARARAVFPPHVDRVGPNPSRPPQVLILRHGRLYHHHHCPSWRPYCRECAAHGHRKEKDAEARPRTAAHPARHRRRIGRGRIGDGPQEECRLHRAQQRQSQSPCAGRPLRPIVYC